MVVSKSRVHTLEAAVVVLRVMSGGFRCAGEELEPDVRRTADDLAYRLGRFLDLIDPDSVARVDF